MSNQRKSAIGVLGPAARTSLILAIILASGCSADVTRFGYGGGGTTSSLPVPPEPVGRGGPPRGLGVTEAPLPPPDMGGNYRVVGREYKTPPPAYEPSPGYDRPQVYGRPPSYDQPPPQTLGPPPDRAPHVASVPRQPAPASDGDTIEVQSGDTLFSIARRHGVSVAVLKEANGLTGDTVRPGQRLAVPSGLQPAPLGRTPVAKAPAFESPVAATQPAHERTATKSPGSGLPPGVEPPPGWEGRYRMKNGDSLYGIAFQHRVSLDELKQANNITDPTKVWSGTILAVPERPHSAAEPNAKAPPRIIQINPKVINAEPREPTPPAVRTAKRSDILSDAPAQVTTGKFRWPVTRGKLISGFGKMADGRHNDGVNLAAPLGTDIVAAESGRVAYADNELKGYGNLILIRHANGWVTAYAHADQVLVRAKDEVRRGQVIGKVGKTGGVDQPQLHFELRQPSGPVDPVPHLGN
jgi:murein DD-endopeptidase MepM/ murein hydrolase activator NlpD